MIKTLITRISKLEQYNATNNTLLWEDTDVNKWESIYGNLRLNDNVIFIANGRLLIGTITQLNNNQSLLCKDIEDIICKNDQLLQVNEIYPELISRVKANFKTFIHPKEVNITQVKKDINNNDFISFYIFKNISEYDKLKTQLKINDRVVLIDQSEKLENVKLHSNNGLISLLIDDNVQISVQGLTLIQILGINENNNSGKRKSNNINRIQNIIDSINKDGYYKFESFFSYHDALYNKQLYNRVTKEEISDITVNVISSNQNIKKNESDNEMPHLNTILYGPPGTGKTYNAVKMAAEIVKGKVNVKNYESAKVIFNDNLGDQIEFITFHQNYSYEDFIQGLRPDVEDSGGLSFKKVDGVFKRIADSAYANIKESEKAPEEISQVKSFENALEILKDKIFDSDEPIKINDTAYFTAVEDDAFRYSGDNWTLGNKGFNGFRMKYSDLERFFEEGVKERKEIKNLTNISGLAKQHATYFIKTFELVKSLMPKTSINVEKTKKKNYVIIIDEINRANISRVFGELITLIEKDKRSHGDIPMQATLPSGDTFMVPSNLYIIGTMNTADKSIALLDIALRRRFTFVGMYPNSDLVQPSVKNQFELLNKKIIELGKGRDFQIGHSYFMGKEFNLVSTMNNKVIPLLMEYFMNAEETVIKLLEDSGFSFKKEASGKVYWPLEIESVKEEDGN